MSTALVGMDVVFTTWYNHFYVSLQEYQARDALDLLWYLFF